VDIGQTPIVLRLKMRKIAHESSYVAAPQLGDVMNRGPVAKATGYHMPLLRSESQTSFGMPMVRANIAIGCGAAA
jgi:hypothetical protein